MRALFGPFLATLLFRRMGSAAWLTGTARPVTRGQAMAARFLALSVDAIQILFLPLFGAGLSPASHLLDVVTSIVMIRLLGWHIAFLPTMIAELLPVVGLVPTWTAAVWIVTRLRRAPAVKG